VPGYRSEALGSPCGAPLSLYPCPLPQAPRQTPPPTLRPPTPPPTRRPLARMPWPRQVCVARLLCRAPGQVNHACSRLMRSRSPQGHSPLVPCAWCTLPPNAPPLAPPPLQANAAATAIAGGGKPFPPLPPIKPLPPVTPKPPAEPETPEPSPIEIKIAAPEAAAEEAAPEEVGRYC
jgi:hypothetical protein